jgi:CHAT domain-containing protein
MWYGRWGVWVVLLLLVSGTVCRGATSTGQSDKQAVVGNSEESPQELARRGQQFFEAQQYQDAVAAYQHALQLFEMAGDRQGQADVRSDLAVVYRAVGDVEQSLTLQRQAIALYRELGDARGTAKALRRIGVLYRHIGDFPQAIAVQEEALALLRAMQDQKGIAMTLTNLGTIYGDLGRLQEARISFEDALQIYTQLQDQQGISYVFGNLGQLALYSGDSQQALQFLEQSLHIKQTLADVRGQANTLINIGTAYKNLGDFQHALTLYYQARELYRQLQDQYGEAVALSSLGTTYEDLGDLNHALELFEQSVALKKLESAPMPLAIALTNLASLLIKKHQFAEAQTYLQEGLQIVAEQGSFLAQAHIYGQLGVLYLRQERLAEALQACTQSLTLYEQAGSPKGVLEAYDSIGAVHLQRGQFQEALSYYENAFRLAKDLNDPQTLWKVQYRLGQIALNSGDETQALTYFIAAADTLEQMRGYLHTPELRQQFAHADLNPYPQIIRILLRRQAVKDALWYLERFKARTLLEIVAYGEPQLQTAPALLQEEQYLLARIRYLSETLRPDTSGGGAENHQVAASIAHELFQAKAQYEQVLMQVKLAYPEYYQLKTVDAAEIRRLMEQACALIEPDVLFLEYFVDDDALHIWTIDGQNIRHTAAPVAAETLVASIITLRTELRQYFSPRVYPLLYQLYTWLLEPVASALEGKTTIGVIPFQALHFVPFSALMQSPWRPDQQSEIALPAYLIERYAVVTLPSLSLLPVVRERSRNNQQHTHISPPHYILGLGNATNDLPGAEQEILTITRDAPDSEGYTGENATKQRLFEEAGKYQIVHVATHGVYDKQHPLFSYLEFASASLYAREIFGLRLWANLVTLSGCETLLPQQVQGEDLSALVGGDELVGFIRAFMYAGTPSVLSSLWRVNDAATQELMGTFYHELPQFGKAKALQHACQTVLRSTLQVGRRRPRAMMLIHPFFWSSFVLVGDWQ